MLDRMEFGRWSTKNGFEEECWNATLNPLI